MRTKLKTSIEAIAAASLVAVVITLSVLSLAAVCLVALAWRGIERLLKTLGQRDTWKRVWSWMDNVGQRLAVAWRALSARERKTAAVLYAGVALAFALQPQREPKREMPDLADLPTGARKTMPQPMRAKPEPPETATIAAVVPEVAEPSTPANPQPDPTSDLTLSPAIAAASKAEPQTKTATRSVPSRRTSDDDSLEAVLAFGRSLENRSTPESDLSWQSHQAHQQALIHQQQAAQFHARTQQRAQESARREMNRYRQQMSGRMGALGARW